MTQYRLPSVLILQRLLPPYRLPFFRALAESKSLDLTVAYGDAAPGSALTSVHQPEGVKSVPIVNWRPLGDDRLVYQRGWLRLIGRGSYDVIIAEFNPRIVSNLAVCAASRLQGVRFIWWGHGFGNRGAKQSWRTRLRLRLVGGSDAIIFYETAQSECFGAFGVPPEKRFVAHNALDTEGIAELARPGSDPSGRHRVLYIGRLIAEKKVALLLRAFAACVLKLPRKTVLTLIGDGPERPALTQLAEKLGIKDHVEFHGSLVDERALAPLFNTSWVSVSPGYVGLSAVHSAAYGLPMIVARNEPHAPEIAVAREGENACYFESNNHIQLADLLASLSADPVEWRRLSDNARHITDARAGLSTMVTAFEDAVAFALSLPHVSRR